MIEPLHIEFDVDCPVQHAFRVWTAKVSAWWPRDHTVSGERDAEVILEGWLGGRIYERTAAGGTHEWGEITAWEPPHRLGYLWYLRRDRVDATEVEVSFVDHGGVTRVEIEHRGWERLGAQGPARRESNTAGWRGVLPHFVAACAAERNPHE